MKLSVNIICGHGSVDGSAIHHVLPVLGMSSCFPIIGHIYYNWSILVMELAFVTSFLDMDVKYCD